ncbi:MAG: aminoacyl-histidine dipeptidase [bacterium]|nr:aminoacyl-histidine dipeptidase [bacterium]
MSDPLAGLSPRSVWDHFASIAAIPRPSKHEERIVAWVRSVAEEHGWEVRSDDIGNLVLCVPATRGRENAPVVVLQAHLDMVCEKNKGVEHDFMNDPIRTRIDGDWVYATGTTLGADNGLGVAAALAAATDPDVTHGPLELLFTLDEETGLTGAQNLDASIVKGRTLLNLDSEEDGVLFVGCAGGADCHLFLDAATEPAPAGHEARRLEIRGLRGGHSGLNIHENRGNALKLAVRVLASAQREGIALEIGDLGGGSMHNAIPREADVTLYVAASDRAAFEKLVRRMADDFRLELRGIDDGLTVELVAANGDGTVLGHGTRDRLIDLLEVLPHGVLGMSGDLAGLVETSNNLAVVQRQNGRFRIVTAARSSVMPTLRSIIGRVRSAARLARAEAETHDGYPGWKPDMASPVLRIVRDVYAEVWGDQPEVTAIHAGLECGLLGEKVSGMDMISFGPQIEGAHSPDERVNVPSVARFWDALARTLDRLSS